VIDIPNLVRETGDKIEIAERSGQRIVFLIEKASQPSSIAGDAGIDREDDATFFLST
jgi:hypothetical protein